MTTRKTFTFALPLLLLLASLIPQGAARAWDIQPQDPVPEPGRPVELRLDALPDTLSPTGSVENILAPDAAVSLVLDDNQHETAYGVNNNTAETATQFIWFNRFTPAPADLPFALNEIRVLFDDFSGALDVDVGDAIDLVVYHDSDGNPTNGATWLATLNETIQAVDGSTWSVYNLSTPVTISGSGDVLIGVIDRFITSGVSPRNWPATIDTTSSQERSYIGWWSGDPPDPATLPPDTLNLMTDTSAGNWMIRGYGATSTSDEIGPTIGTPTYASSTPNTSLAVVSADISDAASGGNGVLSATLYYGYSAPYNQNSVAGTGPGGNGDGTWSFTIPPQGVTHVGQTLYFSIQACDNDATSACSTNDDGGSYFPLLIGSESPAAVSFPFYDGFESGKLDTGWSEYVTAEGRVQVSANYPYAGTYSLLLDDSVDNTTYSHAAAILTIDLSGQSNVELSFWWREFDEEDHADDGVFISDDNGASWHRVVTFGGDQSTWGQAIVDIDAQAAANGVALNDHFQIKFQFYDNWPIAPSGSADGYAIDEVYVQAEPHRLFMPCVLRKAGPPDQAPVLNPIDNPTGDYDYTVTWGTVDGATGYTLEEDDNAGFSSPTTVYQGSNTSRNIVGKDLGTYYYRVKASNDFGESGWSNVESTTVTTEKPPCPQAGSWSGTTNQGRSISFTVAHSPRCEVQDLAISYRYTCTSGSYFTVRTEFMSTQAITNDHFDTGGSAPRVKGDFSSTTTANGTWSYSGWDPYNPGFSCSGSGTWTATYSP